MTVVRDERVMLPLWTQHYGAQLGVENLYVIDDNSTDGSTDHLPCDLLHLPPIRDGRFEQTRVQFLAGMVAALGKLYDCVVFTDADEFLVPDPERYDGLRDFLSRRPAETQAVAALGLNVVHAGAEPPLDLSRPVLEQRRLGKFLPVMCKPAVNFVAAPWYAASHGIRAPYRVDPDLWMFHLKFADRCLLREAADRRRALVLADGRCRRTSWHFDGEEMVDLLDEIGAQIGDPESVTEFRAPSGSALEDLVTEERDCGGWRAPKGGQVELMRTRPFARIPERFRQTV
jgi:hypothetical protein